MTAALNLSCLAVLVAGSAFAAPPVTVFETVFPAGGQAGQAVDVTVTGSNLEMLHGNVPGLKCELLKANQFRLTIPAGTPPGLYDLWGLAEQGVSSPRTFFVGNRPEQIEAEPNDEAKTAPSFAINGVLAGTVNGRIEKPGDVDCFRFTARQGQRVIVVCWADRIDSRLRAVLEVFDGAGRRLAVNRGYFGNDPLIDFHVPADGEYIVKIQDLISAGGADHYYRLDLDTGPRVAFTVPAVVERGKSSRVTLYGWNLSDKNQSPPATFATGDGTQTSPAGMPDGFDRIEVEIPASQAEPSWPLPVRFTPAQAVFAGLAYHLRGSHAAIALGVTDVPVVLDRTDNHSPATAQAIAVPCEVSGQIVTDDERDWYSISALRGEVLHVEVLAHRINSPADLDVSVFDASGARELAQFSDEVRNLGGSAFSTSHLDPFGRWVVPADGKYLIAVRNLGGGLPFDPRRVYRFSLRREDGDVQVVAVPHADGPLGLTVRRGGREVLDLVAFRRRGFTGPIRITGRDLPEGIECPDVWLGPGIERGTLVVSADQNAAGRIGELKLESITDDSGAIHPSSRAVRGATVVRSGLPSGWSRLTSEIPLAVAGTAPVRITADGHETVDHHLYGKLQVKHSPGGILDVAVTVERRDSGHQAPVSLSGVGLPDLIRNQTAVIPAGQSRGYLSFYLPATLPVGKYSLAIKAETTVPTPDKKTELAVAHSNAITIDVQPAGFLVEVDPFAPVRAKRGDVLQVKYTAQRQNGFIGKMHTELAAPGRVTDVIGLRGRGETFVGQTDKGMLQIVVNDDAPLGRQQFLRLFTVGIREDQPAYFGSCFLPLEIVE